jgi:hypothetical protein
MNNKRKMKKKKKKKKKKGTGPRKAKNDLHKERSRRN